MLQLRKPKPKHKLHIHFDMYMISLYFCTHSSSKLAKDNESDTFRMRVQRIQH